MRVIRTLSETGSVEDREDEKKKLEQKFRESDTKVDQVCPAVRFIVRLPINLFQFNFISWTIFILRKIANDYLVCLADFYISFVIQIHFRIFPLM